MINSFRIKITYTNNTIINLTGIIRIITITFRLTSIQTATVTCITINNSNNIKIIGISQWLMKGWTIWHWIHHPAIRLMIQAMNHWRIVHRQRPTESLSPPSRLFPLPVACSSTVAWGRQGRLPAIIGSVPWSAHRNWTHRHVIAMRSILTRAPPLFHLPASPTILTQTGPLRHFYRCLTICFWEENRADPSVTIGTTNSMKQNSKCRPEKERLGTKMREPLFFRWAFVGQWLCLAVVVDWWRENFS